VAKRGQPLAHAGEQVHVEVGDHVGLLVGGDREDEPPRVDDHAAPAGPVARRVLADLVGGDHEGLVLDRARPEKDLPVVARGGECERGRHGEDAGAAQREAPVELWEANVVADAHAHLDAVGGRGENRFRSWILVLGFGVAGAVDLNVEEVQLAVDRRDLAVGADVDRRVVRFLRAVDALGDRTGDQVDAQLARRGARPRDRLAVERLSARAQVGAGAEHRPLLWQDDELCAVGRRRADVPVRAREVAFDVVGRVDLNRCSAH
jgi:hypothetical protein